MNVPHPVARRRIEIGDTHGLHLRPAARFVEAATRFDAEIRVRCNGSEADGKSVLSLICLAAGRGVVLDVEARGHDAGEAVLALADLLTLSPEDVERRGPSPGVAGERPI